MRVLYCSQGQAVHDRRFIRAMVDQGHEVLHVRLGGERLNGSSSEDERVIEATRGAWPFVAPLQGLEIRNAVDEFQPEVIHAGPVQRAPVLAAVQGLRPLVTMSWGSDILADARSGTGRLAAEFVLARSDAFLCDCDAVRTRAVQLGMNPSRIITFPWGADLELFSPGPAGDLKTRLGWENQLVLLSTRPWASMYGLDVLIMGFIKAATEAADLRLLLLNGGPLEREIRSSLDDAGLGDRVHFAGLIDPADLPDYYRAADLYLSASRVDGSSVSLLEAMASGLPPIASSIPGNQEWVVAGQTGWLFEDGNSESLACSILEAAREPRTRQRVSQAANRVAVEKADWSENSLKLSEAYELARSTVSIR